MKLYLHEIIHVVGTGSEAYKRHTGALGLGREDGGAPLVGTFQQSGSTGDWPKVVNLWEMNGWDHWTTILERQYTRSSGQEAGLKRWWTDATAWRSGGFDRILAPARFSPTRAELLEHGVRGLACIQELTTVRPGGAQAYLDSVRRHWLTPAQDRGLTLMGAYTTAMRDTEAVLLWVLPTFGDFTRHLGTLGRDRASRRWLERAHRHRVDFRETLLVPSPWCVVHPDFVDQAPSIEPVAATEGDPTPRSQPRAAGTKRRHRPSRPTRAPGSGDAPPVV